MVDGRVGGWVGTDRTVGVEAVLLVGLCIMNRDRWTLQTLSLYPDI